MAATLMLTLSGPVALAGPGGGHSAKDPAEQAAMMAEKLGLDAGQTAAVESILYEAAEERDAIMAQHPDKSGRELMRAVRGEMKDVAESTRSKLAEVLDEEQLAAFDQMREERRARMRSQGGKRGY